MKRVNGQVEQANRQAEYINENLRRMAERTNMCRPRNNRLPQQLASRPPPHSFIGTSSEELNSRPEAIGQSYDVARTHFPQLSPGRAFGFSQDGRFAKFGRGFWEHVSDVYDWERSISRDPHFRPGIREMATGIRLIVGDDLADHIATPHNFLLEDGSSKLSQDQRMALTQYKYLVMVFQGPSRSGQEDFVILLLQMPNQYVLTFSASNGTPEGKKDLHQQALNALDNMLRNSDLPAIRWSREGMGRMMKVTPDSRNWANPYLTLEAFRVFIREARRQECDYEDWPFSQRYLSLPKSERTGDRARDMWLGDLRGALGSPEDQPLQSDVTQTQPHNHMYNQAYPDIAGSASNAQRGYPGMGSSSDTWIPGGTGSISTAYVSPVTAGSVNSPQEGFPWMGSPNNAWKPNDAVSSSPSHSIPGAASGASGAQNRSFGAVRSLDTTWQEYGGGVPSQPGLDTGDLSESHSNWGLPDVSQS